MPGSGKVLSTLLFYRALTEQQSWQEIAQSKAMTYLQRLPELVPEGQFLVHNSARPMHLWLPKIVSGLAQMPRWAILALGCLTS